MANVKITDLGAYTNPVSTDVLPIVDVGADVTKKVSIADLLENAGSGTAAAPGIAFDGDSDTGIYRPGANQVAISSNGVGRVFIDANGQVSISSQNSATIPLRIYSSSNAGDAIEFVGRTTNGKNQLQFYSADGTTAQFQITSTNNNVTFKNQLNTDISFWTNNTERARIDSSGKLLVGMSSEYDGSLLQVNDDRIRIASSKTPASASDTGTAGEICWDSSYIYVCTATDTWKRAALSTW